jgi:hypothetical protein
MWQDHQDAHIATLGDSLASKLERSPAVSKSVIVLIHKCNCSAPKISPQRTSRTVGAAISPGIGFRADKPSGLAADDLLAFTGSIARSD